MRERGTSSTLITTVPQLAELQVELMDDEETETPFFFYSISPRAQLRFHPTLLKLLATPGASFINRAVLTDVCVCVCVCVCNATQSVEFTNL